MIAVTAKFFADQVTEPTARRLWQTAAEQLRFPFWDFCRPSSGSYDDVPHLRYGCPTPMSVKFVRVLKPNATEYINIKNPLYSYTFPTDAKINAACSEVPFGRNRSQTAGAELVELIKRFSPGRVDNTPAYTVRWPTGTPARSQNDILEFKATQTVDVQRLRLYYTLTYQQSFPQVSCSAPIENGEVKNSEKGADYKASLENIHDDYHDSG
jgi:hypothetical protein